MCCLRFMQLEVVNAGGELEELGEVDSSLYRRGSVLGSNSVLSLLKTRVLHGEEL
mgnify:CR=1 FL=1